MPHKDPDVRRAYQREYQRRWARANRDKRLVYEKNWHDKNPGTREKYRQINRDRHPEKQRARGILSKHVADGKIIRQPCEVCGVTTDVQGHHDDYSKPLEVRWLCRTHHMEVHRCVA